MAKIAFPIFFFCYLQKHTQTTDSYLICRSVKVLSKVISKKEYSPMVRSLAVYSLKKAAMLEPIHVRPILLTIIDNIAEASEVRIAAVAGLPWSQPTTAELQKIATRTWFEPSKQVASFIFSTFKSLVRNISYFYIQYVADRNIT